MKEKLKKLEKVINSITLEEKNIFIKKIIDLNIEELKKSS